MTAPQVPIGDRRDMSETENLYWRTKARTAIRGFRDDSVRKRRRPRFDD